MTKSTVQQARQTRFSQVPKAEIPRSTFDRSSGLKTTMESSELVPIFVDEALPGDTMNLSVATFARMATPLHPVMDNQYLDLFFFAVPMRLLWDNWQKFNGEQTDPGDSVDFLIPQTQPPVGGYVNGSLSDYLGLPTREDIGEHSAMWHRGYNLIYNEWFRDQNLIDSVTNNTGDGPDPNADYTLLKRGKRHDYFTSALPFPQKGPAVLLPLGTSAPVTTTLDASSPFNIDGTGDPTFDLGGSTGLTIGNTSGINTAEWSAAPSGNNEATWNDPNLEVNINAAPATGTADLSAATSATINEIREAFQIQKLYERDARGGSRYTEIVRAHFGVSSPDSRLQRPEYLGGSTTVVNVHPIAAQTEFQPTPSKYVGDLGAFVTAGSAGRGFVKSFTEHCVIIGLACFRADLTYQQGLDRMMSRNTRWEFYWPALAHLGEQTILNKEIFADGSAADELVFGYQERFAEYRYKQSKITGKMRSNDAVTLDTWHLAQDFAALPLLNKTFIEENVPTARVIAVPSEPAWLFDAWFNYTCVRPMPTYGVPGNVDRF